MMSVGIARIILDGRHVAGLRYSLEDAQLAARLIGAGVPAKLYAGKSEGRVLDLARQLVRMRTDLYLFGVSDHTLGVTCELARQLAALRPDAQFMFQGACAGANPAQLAAMATMGTHLASELLGELDTELLARAGIAAGAMRPEAVVSPYLSGLLPASDVVRLGLVVAHPDARFERELAWLAANAPPAGSAVPLHAQGLDGAALLAVLEHIERLGLQCAFDWHVDAAACSAALFGALSPERCNRLVVSGDPQALPAVPAWMDRRIAAAEGEAHRTARAAVYGKNGNVALHTGFYFDAKQTPGIYHLEVPLGMADAERERVYAWAAPSMDIRSAAVLKGAHTEVHAKLPDFAAPLSRETGGWPKHAYAIGTDNDAASITFDGEDSTRQQMRYVPLSALDASGTPANTVTFITMKDSADADELVRRLDVFHTQGEVRVRHPKFPVYFENGCRWMGYGTCRLPMLRRVEVNQAMELRSCRDAGSVGSLADSYDQIAIRVKQQQQMEEVRRECAACPVRDSCSHCTQLPAEWGGRYCEIRKQYAHSPLYLELQSILPMLGPVLGDGAEPALTLKVSYSGLPNQHYSGPTGVRREGARPVIVSVHGQHIAWWRGSPRLSRLSAPMAMMAEAWWEGADEERIGNALATTFQVDDEVARSSLAEGMARLVKEGVIHA